MSKSFLQNWFTAAALILSGGMFTFHAGAQQSDTPKGIDPEEWRQVQLMGTMMQGMSSPILSLRFIDGETQKNLGITQEQMREILKKSQETFQSYEEEIQKKYGSPKNFSMEKTPEIAEDLSKMMKKVNEISQNLMKETFSEDAMQKIDQYKFQQFGGTFSGALSVTNLATLHLTDEQKEKANAILEKLNKERFPLILQMGKEISQTEKNPALINELLDKIISQTIRGQKEIETLFTPEQMKLADEIMAETPDNMRFMSNYLKNRPWRLDESSWKPGDGAPPDLENYPREMRKRRDRDPNAPRVPGANSP
ncbi:MAG: hypothetical protein LBT05_09515 [Planctomycetaceae bacterium]|jgi:uncharacterized membrane-anchored protein YhcB (DUF1043 family)|nr:hypothetical protein [Planctomycetaceae bacterium]